MIPRSPISNHDLAVIQMQIVALRSRLAGVVIREVHVSDRRLAVDGLRTFGVPVRRRSNLDLNAGLVVCEGHEPISFDFEIDRPVAQQLRT